MILVPISLWIVTSLIILLFLSFDYFFTINKDYIFILKYSIFWSIFYIVFAVIFGFWFSWYAGYDAGIEYFASYITEKTLSIDNVFIFLIIIKIFKVPKQQIQKVIYFGILFAILSRSLFISLGAVAINKFNWIFYFFGIILFLPLLSSIQSKIFHYKNKSIEDIILSNLSKKIEASNYHGGRFVIKSNRKYKLTPMIFVIFAISFIDLLFAVDSIPAVFGLTTNVYIVFIVNAFSLIGLKQLFFLLQILHNRLIFLSTGLSLIMSWIGVKLIINALHDNNLQFINNGNPVTGIPVISSNLSLLIISLVLILSIIGSLVYDRLYIRKS